MSYTKPINETYYKTKKQYEDSLIHDCILDFIEQTPQMEDRLIANFIIFVNEDWLLDKSIDRLSIIKTIRKNPKYKNLFIDTIKLNYFIKAVLLDLYKNYRIENKKIIYGFNDTHRYRMLYVKNRMKQCNIEAKETTVSSTIHKAIGTVRRLSTIKINKQTENRNGKSS